MEFLRSEREIIESWRTTFPLLSMVCISYNHEKFIEKTLVSFLEQVTNFPIEIICYDDCSSDTTRKVIEKYQKRYPNIIKVMFPEENQFKKGVKPFIDIVLPQCRGNYIARCECDDYWTDPQKVQKQVSFLEQNKEYVLVTHDIHTIDENDNFVSSTHLDAFYKRDFTSEELRCAWAGPVTQAILFRNVIKEFPPEFAKTFLGDVFLASLLGQFGASKYMADISPSMYRLHSGGIFSPLTESDKFDMQAYSFFWMYKYYKRVGMVNEARVFKIKSLEKQMRNLTFADWLRLFLVRFFKFNLKKQLD